MGQIANALVILLLIAAVAGVGLGSANAYARVVALFRSRHPDVWASLGKPGMPEGAFAHRRLRPFLISGKYKTLHDGELDRLARTWRLLQLLQIVVIVVIAAALMHHVGVWR